MRSPNVTVGRGTPSRGGRGTDSEMLCACASMRRGQLRWATMSLVRKAALPYTWSQW